MLFPTALATLSVLFYGSLALLGALNYLASIGHRNQIQLNNNQQETLHELPFNLHRNSIFSQWVLFFAHHVTDLMAACYCVGLVACAFSGLYLFAGAATLMLLVDQTYREGWFPKSFNKPYTWITDLLFLNFLLGNTLSITLNLINFFISAWDYVQLHIYKTRPTNPQFPFASPTHEQTPLPQHLHELESLLSTMNKRKTQVTFDHFEEANDVSNSLYTHVPTVDFNQYLHLFEQLDFSSQALQNKVMHEMNEHHKYSEKSHKTHALELNLPTETSIPEIKIAWLKREMNLMAHRLKNPSYRDLSHETMATMHGQASYLLAYLNEAHDKVKKENILLTLALQTGSHCNGSYVDTFADLNQHYTTFHPTPLTTRERVILAAQSIREEQFRAYYYAIMTQLQHHLPVSQLLWDDIRDHYTYEYFVTQFGSFYYLRNPELQTSQRTFSDIIHNTAWYYLLSTDTIKHVLKKSLFSDYYNSETLVHEILEGKLHEFFRTWCEETYPGSYDAFVWDDDNLSVKTKSTQAIKLAELMLLDLGLVESQKETTHHAFNHKKQNALFDLSFFNQGATSPVDFSIPLRQPVNINMT